MDVRMENAMQDIDITDEEQLAEMKKWFFKENVRIEQIKSLMEEERKLLEEEKKSFLIKKENQFNRNNLLKKQLEREKKLFDKKWKILERELRRLAEEKKRLEREKQMYQEVKKVQAVGTVNGEVFFNGVNSEKSLKKRYKDLLKIYHPDNANGDTQTIQAIMREYNRLKNLFS